MGILNFDVFQNTLVEHAVFSSYACVPVLKPNIVFPVSQHNFLHTNCIRLCFVILVCFKAWSLDPLMAFEGVAGVTLVIDSHGTSILEEISCLNSERVMTLAC